MYRRKGRGRLLLLAFLALSILVITLDFRQGSGGPLERIRDISAAVVAPIQRGFTAVTRPIGNFFSSIADLADLREENRELSAELDDIRSDIDRAQALLDENASLREHFDLQKSWPTMEMITAEVIAEESSNYRWAVQIAAGRADGVRKDMAVINPDGLVGKIIQVNDHVSTVLLLIDPQAAARARVGDAADRGTIKGNGAGRDLSLDDIGPNADVEIGDEVITAGYDLGIFPPGIPIGVVSDASVKGAAVNKAIDIESFVDFNSLDFVQVLLESGRRLQPGADEEKVSDR